MSQLNLNGSQISGFSALLYVNFIIKKRYRVDDIAKEMQIATDTLYRYIRGENIMPADRIIDLVQATGDIEYLEYFCEPAGYLPVAKPEGKPTRETRERDEISVMRIWGHALDDIEKAYEDGKMDRREYAEIHRHLICLQETAAALDAKLAKEVEDGIKPNRPEKASSVCSAEKEGL